MGLVPAGPGLRLFAWATDLLIQFAFLLLAGWVLLSGDDTKAGGGIFLVLLFVVWWGYPVLFEVFAQGRTPGKRWQGLQVVKRDGLPVGWRESILRNVLLAADFLPLLYGTGFACMAIDDKFRRLGDLVAGTLVVHRERKWTPSVGDGIDPVPLPFPLLPAEQRALLDLLDRLGDLPPARAVEIGDQAEVLTGTVGGESTRRLRAMATGLLK